MKVPPKGWALLGGLAAILIVGRMAMDCDRGKPFTIAPPAGTKIRLETYSDTTIKIGGLTTQEVNVKMSLEQLLRFTSPPGTTQRVEIENTENCFVDAGQQNVISVAGAEEALRGFAVEMAIRPTGEPVSITPHIKGDPPAFAQTFINSQITTLQAAGPMGYTLKAEPPKVGESWTATTDLSEAVRQSSNEYVTPISATATYTYTYVGETTLKVGEPQLDGIRVHHLKRTGKGSILQQLNVEGMPGGETGTKMTSEGDIYIDAGTGLLIYMKTTDTAAIDFGAIEMNQTTKSTVKGSRAR